MRVLFATDGSESSNAALTMLEGLGDKDEIDVTVMSISPFRRERAGQPRIPPKMRSDVWEHVHRTADRATRRLQDAKFNVITRIEEGEARHRIVEAATSDDLDLVVVGAGEHSWLDRLLLGSTSRYVLHRSEASVMVVHEMRGQALPVRVLVASDGSPAAAAAADQLRRFADSGKCVVTVLSVAEPAAQLLPPMPQAVGDVESGAEVQDYLAGEAVRGEEAARDVTQTEAARFRAEGFRVDEELAVGGPASQVILEEAHRGGADLVVVGASGISPVGAAALGSTADAIARNTRAALVGRSSRASEDQGETPEGTQS